MFWTYVVGLLFAFNPLRHVELVTEFHQTPKQALAPVFPLFGHGLDVQPDGSLLSLRLFTFVLKGCTLVTFMSLFPLELLLISFQLSQSSSRHLEWLLVSCEAYGLTAFLAFLAWVFPCLLSLLGLDRFPCFPCFLPVILSVSLSL